LVVIVNYLQRLFYDGPEYDGTGRFYDWVREHTRPDSRLLNLGAGPATLNPARTFRGEVAEVIGADVDPIVLTNPELDRAVLLENDRLPFNSNSFDLVLSDYVLEHVEHPGMFLAEVHRVLRPGQSFFFRTPNIYHYVALISAATPHSFHNLIANRARANPEDAQEPWPTFYRLNSRRAIKVAARQARFSASELRMVEMEPSYLRFLAVPFLLGIGYERLVNSTGLLAGLRANIFGRLVK
jgi:SAM-dependent methyltransferase